MSANMEPSAADQQRRARHSESLRSLQRRLVQHIADGRTTDMVAAPMVNAASVYTDPAQYAAEQQKLFLDMPLVAGLSGDIPHSGDTLVFDGAGRPIIVVRGDDGQARAFLNICTHRGARPVGQSGRHAAFTCPFHGWSFGLDGRLVGQPGKDCFEGLDAAQLGLVPLPCVEWHGLIFVKAQPGGTIDVEAHLGSFAPVIADIGLASFTAVNSTVMKAEANWKSVLETFGEGYHFASLHPTTLAQTHFSNVSVFDRFDRHHRVCFSVKTNKALIDTPEAQWPELDSVMYMIFPNTTMLVGSPMTGHIFVQLFRVCPSGISSTDTLFTLYAPPRNLQGEGLAVAQAGFEVAKTIIQTEDFSVAAAAQRNFETAPPDFKVCYGRNEPALQYLHRDIAAALGAS